jgi:hypothetical protein
MTNRRRFAVPARRAGRRLVFESLDARVALSVGPAPSFDHAFDNHFAGGPAREAHLGPTIERSFPGMESARWSDPRRGLAPGGPGAGYGGTVFTALPPGGWIVVVEVVVLPQAQAPLPLHETPTMRPTSPGGPRADASFAALSQNLPGSAPAALAIAGNLEPAGAIEPISVASFLTNGTAATPETAKSFDASAGMSLLPAPRIDESPVRDSRPAADAMLEPLSPDAADGEGGLIELEDAPNEERPSPQRLDGDSATEDARGSEDAADLQGPRSEWLSKEESQDEPQSPADAIERIADVQCDAEGGMIELAAPGEVVDVPQTVYAAGDRAHGDDDLPGAMEAGVALFQAFELGTGSDAGQAARDSATAPAADRPGKSDRAEHPDAAAMGWGLLAALPAARLRRRRAEQEPRHPRLRRRPI